MITAELIGRLGGGDVTVTPLAQVVASSWVQVGDSIMITRPSILAAVLDISSGSQLNSSHGLRIVTGSTIMSAMVTSGSHPPGVGLNVAATDLPAGTYTVEAIRLANPVWTATRLTVAVIPL